MQEVKWPEAGTPEEVVTRQQLLQRQVDIFNAKEEISKDGLNCPLCKNKTLIQKVVFENLYQDYNIVMIHCACRRKRASLEKARKSGLGDYVSKRVSDYIANEEWQKNIKHKAIDYLKSESKDWFVLLGQSGSGKTLIASIIANYNLIKLDRDVLYITWTDFVAKVKYGLMNDEAGEVRKYLDEAKNIEVLFIDELLKKYSEADLKYIIEIINYRYAKNLQTIITSEKSMEELLNIDEATFGRMVERAGKNLADVSKDRSKNYRLRGCQI